MKRGEIFKKSLPQRPLGLSTQVILAGKGEDLSYKTKHLLLGFNLRMAVFSQKRWTHLWQVLATPQLTPGLMWGTRESSFRSGEEASRKMRIEIKNKKAILFSDLSGGT